MKFRIQWTVNGSVNHWGLIHTRENLYEAEITFEAIDPTAIDDYVFYMKNTGDTPIFIDEAFMDVNGAISAIEFDEVTGTAGGSLTTVTPVNMNVGDANAPDAQIVTSPDITGLTRVGSLGLRLFDVVDVTNEIHFPGKIILPKSRAVAIGVKVATAILSGSIYFYAHTPA